MSEHAHRDRPAPGGGPLALPAAGLRLAAALAARPSVLLRRGASLALDLSRAGLAGPLLRRPERVLEATVAAASGVLDDAAADPARLPPDDVERLRALLTGPAAPPEPGTRTTGDHPAPRDDPGPAVEVQDRLVPERVFTPPGPDDPAVPFDTGARAALPGPVPGRDVAATPGAVVLRTQVFELVQYLPVTEQVHDTPVLVVPPLVHRYWLADLAPGFSLVEHLVRGGLQVFALSWHPDGPTGTARALDSRSAAVLDALEASIRISRASRASLVGVRSGGLLAAAVQAHLAEVGLDDRVAAAAYLGTVLEHPAPPRGPRPVPSPPVPVPQRVTHALRTWSEDLLPGPPAPGPDPGPELTVLGTPVRPAELRRDGYLVAAADDPERGWADGYRTAGLLGGRCRLVLAPGDRAGALVTPPGTATAFRVAGCDAGDGPDRWRDAAPLTDGSWWDDLADWLATRSGVLRDAPPELGGRHLPPLFPAPGTYLGSATGTGPG